MATYQKGILEGLSGKLGNLVFAQRKGVTVIRSRPGPRLKESFTQKQVEQQAKFSLMVRFLRPLTGLLNQTFGRNAKAMSCFNAALSYNIKHSIVGHFPALRIDYSEVQLSRGNLQGIASAICIPLVAGKLAFIWSYNSSSASQAADLVFLAVYCQDFNQWVYCLGAAQRDTEIATLKVNGFIGKSVQTWMGFISADGNNSSNSFYTGMVTVS